MERDRVGCQRIRMFQLSEKMSLPIGKQENTMASGVLPIYKKNYLAQQPVLNEDVERKQATMEDSEELESIDLLPYSENGRLYSPGMLFIEILLAIPLQATKSENCKDLKNIQIYLKD